MKRIKAGAVLLSIWSGVNLLLALGILGAMTLAGRHPPSMPLFLTEGQIAALDPRAVGLIHSLAVFANACAAALCLLVLVVTWKGVVARVRWAWFGLAAAMGLAQAFGFASDAYLQHQNLAANAGSTALLVAGLALSWPATRRINPA